MSAGPRWNRDDGGTATAGVADALAHMVAGLPPGASLPSEAELAAHHGVSRVTMREAVKMVAGRGLLELARGRRAVVRVPDASALGQFMSSIVRHDPDGMFHLVEARLSLEVQCAGLAAHRATPAVVAAMADALAEMHRSAEASGPDADVRFHAADFAFHRAIVEASGNSILVGLFDAMTPALQRSFSLTREGRSRRGHGFEHTMHAHQRILYCIKSHDQPGAEAAMRVHLHDATRDMKAALERA